MKSQILIAINSEFLICSQNIDKLNLDSVKHKKLINDLNAFSKIIKNKTEHNIKIVLLDKVNREDKTNKKYSPRYNELLNSIDIVINLSRCPMILPFIIQSKEQKAREQKYRNIGNYGDRHKKGDAVVVSDAINAKCDYLLIADYKLLAKHNVISEAKKDGLIVTTPSNFLEELNEYI